MRSLATLLLSCLLAACATRVPPEHAAIVAAARRYLKTDAAPTVGATKIEVQEVEGNHARVYVTPLKPTTDPATMYLVKKAGGSWEGVTIGTGFSPEDFKDLHLPESIRD